MRSSRVSSGRWRKTQRLMHLGSCWETPWSLQQGRVGWLFRGQFLKTELKEGVILDVDGTLLERCEEKP